jgi:hypothetical protein
VRFKSGFVGRILGAGVRGYVSKSVSIPALLHAIGQTPRGERVVLCLPQGE